MALQAFCDELRHVVQCPSPSNLRDLFCLLPLQCASLYGSGTLPPPRASGTWRYFVSVPPVSRRAYPGLSDILESTLRKGFPPIRPVLLPVVNSYAIPWREVRCAGFLRKGFEHPTFPPSLRVPAFTGDIECAWVPESADVDMPLLQEVASQLVTNFLTLMHIITQSASAHRAWEPTQRQVCMRSRHCTYITLPAAASSVRHTIGSSLLRSVLKWTRLFLMIYYRQSAPPDNLRETHRQHLSSLGLATKAGSMKFSSSSGL